MGNGRLTPSRSGAEENAPVGESLGGSFADTSGHI